jgi:hypothetical protein
MDVRHTACRIPPIFSCSCGDLNKRRDEKEHLEENPMPQMPRWRFVAASREKKMAGEIKKQKKTRGQKGDGRMCRLNKTVIFANGAHCSHFAERCCMQGKL